MTLNPSAKKYFLIALAVFAADQLTKYYVMNNMPLYGSIPVTSFFNIVSARNKGAAFGMFRGWGNMPFIAISIVVLAGISGLLIYGKKDRFALSLILAGAAGNMADRIMTGAVVDFLDFYVFSHHWPAFNVADTALTCGIGLMLIANIRKVSERADAAGI
ncbi:MAG: signal peptidase II [Candidatus Magnetominusculus sp. LBB02]|nr:signal peptidase II [Candidatus Magnetominusculus sp. LBB02]